MDKVYSVHPVPINDRLEQCIRRDLDTGYCGPDTGLDLGRSRHRICCTESDIMLAAPWNERGFFYLVSTKHRFIIYEVMCFYFLLPQKFNQL